jgi:hypothetical protein
MKLLKAVLAPLLIALAVVIGANPRNVYSQAQALLYGSYMNAAKAVTVTSNGYLNVSVQGGGAGVVSPANGGTGISSYAVGDMLYASGATTLSKLAAVATGNVLCSAGITTAPAWCASPSLTNVTTTTQFLGANGSNTAPTYAFTNDADTGWYSAASNSGSAVFAGNSTRPVQVGGNGVFISSDAIFGFSNVAGNATTTIDAGLSRISANLLAIGNSSQGDFTGSLKLTSLFPVLGAITVGTDDTTTNIGDVTRVRYQATITPASGGAGNCATQAAGFKAANTNADCVIATLPAGVKIVGAYADVTAGFTCSGTCSGTKVFRMGISAGGTEVFATSLNVAATGTFGLADADMGSGLTRAAAIQGGYLPSWSGATTITARFTSGTGNWGNASSTFVNAGSIKFTLVTELEK